VCRTSHTIVLHLTLTHPCAALRCAVQNIARRNSLLTHTSAALRQLQRQLDAVDAFVRHHFTGPWEDAGLKDTGRHWLDTVARWVQAGLTCSD
jgi:hypothetical protein